MAGPKGYLLNEAAATWLKGQVTKQEGVTAPPDVRQFVDGPSRKVYLRNGSAETIPAFGICRVNSYTATSDGRLVADVVKPTNVIGNNTFLVNGPGEIEPSKFGVAQSDAIQVVAYETGFTFSASDNYGVNGWKLDRIPTSGKPLVNAKIYCDYDATRKLCLASIRPLERILIQGSEIAGRVGLIEQGGNCYVLTNNTATDELYVSDVVVKVYNWTTSSVLTHGDGYGAAIWIDGRWKIIAEDCNDEGSTLPPVTKTGTFTSIGNPISTSVQTVTMAGSFSSPTFSQGATPIP